MAKEFYTEIDIEDMVKRGVMSLSLNDQVVLTELAYEKARALGLQLVHPGADTPPSAPIRPYLSRQPAAPASSPAPAVLPSANDLQERIRQAVAARLGNQVDPQLLDVIIQRVLKSTGMK
jgi:hypothetical protein